VADVVEGLDREPGDDGRIAHDDRDPLRRPSSVAGDGQPLPDGEARAGVPAVEDVVWALRASREAADAAQLAQRPEAGEATGEQLVRVGLVTGVPDDAIGRAVKEPMEGHRQLHHAERAAEMAARLGHRLDDRRADLRAELDKLDVAQTLEIGRAGDRGEDRQRGWLPVRLAARF